MLQLKGPITVTEKCGGYVFIIQVDNKKKTFQANLLKHYVEREKTNDNDVEHINATMLDANAN